MTKLPLISSDAVIRKLKISGFEIAPHAHEICYNPDRPIYSSVPSVKKEN